MIFFCPFPSLFHPLAWHSLPEAKTIFFFLQKKQTLMKKALWKTLLRHRNVFVWWGEGSQTGVTLDWGVQYTSSKNGDQSYSEKYAHGRESAGEGWYKNLPAPGKPERTRTTWTWETFRRRCSSANHLQSTLSDMLKLSRKWKGGTNTTRFKPKKWFRDHRNVGTPPSHAPVKSQKWFDRSTSDLQKNHHEKHYRHTAEKDQLKPGLVHRE